MKSASGDKIIVIQDDMIIQEEGWNVRMEKPFKAFDDVFAVTANTAHNRIFNTNSVHIFNTQTVTLCYTICFIYDRASDAFYLNYKKTNS